VWLLAGVPVALIALGMAVSLVVAGVSRYQAQRVRDDIAAADASAARNASASASAPTGLTGEAVDLSTVMGRARKLANEWQPEAALLGIEATLHHGKIQTQEGAAARLTFGPSPFAASPTKGGLFVVVYDRSGLSGAPAAGKSSKALPEPMCAPEHVLARLTELGEGPFSLRYALDASQRPMWLANPGASPEQQRLLDPQDCQPHGLVVGRNKR
jgi:hypothetical protein